MNFHISHSSFKAFKMLLVVLLLDSSKVCPAPKRLRWATVLPQQLLASLGALHVQALHSACIVFTILHHRPLVQIKGGKQTSEYQKTDCIPFHSNKIQVVELSDHADYSPELMATDNRPNPMNLYSTCTSCFYLLH